MSSEPVRLLLFGGLPMTTITEAKGFHEYDYRDFDAADLHMRSVGARPLKLAEFQADQAKWDDLHGKRKAAVTAARQVMANLTDSTDQDECRKAERAHDIIVAAIELIDGEMDRRKAFGQTTPLTLDQRGVPAQASGTVYFGQDGSRFVPDGERSGPSGWEDRKGNEIRVLSPKDSFANGERSELSIGRYLRAVVCGPSNDVERRALAEGTDSAGGYTVPAPLAAQFIDRLRAASVCVRAGARTIPMTSKTLAIATLESDPTVAWRAENSQISPSDPTFGVVEFDAKSLMGLVIASRELLDDTVNASAMLENAFIEQTALKFDQGLLFGTGADNQPTGLSNVSGLASVSMGTNGAALTNYDKLLDAIYEIQVANGGNPNAMVHHPRTGLALAKLKDSDGNPLRVPEMVAAVRSLPTTSVPIDQTQGTSNAASSILFGDFTKMLIGMRNELVIRVLNERYADYNQVGFVFGMRADVQLERKAHFSKLVGITA